MAHNEDHIIEQATGYIESEGGFVMFVRNVGFGGITMAVILNVISAINSFGNLLMAPVRALGEGTVQLVDFLFMAFVSVLDAGTATTAYSFREGLASLLGPFAQPSSVGIVMLSFAVFMFAVNRLDISPLAFIRSFRR